MPSNRFTYVKYDQEHAELQEKFKALFEEVDTLIEQSIITGRARTLLLMHLEEAYMWSGKAIRDQQLAKLTSTQHVPERG